MSLGYAEKLSYREDLGGQLGAPELFDSPEEVDRKVTKLAELVRQSNKIIAFTGAGISTACGIPDFRGPSGVWTLQRAGKPLPRLNISFAAAKPSFTHASLSTLMKMDKLKYIVSQNVDGLHLRSGIPRHKIAELHGNCFAERCIKCKTEYIRDFEVETVGFKPTGRKCTVQGCDGKLHDHVLDWEDELPPDELELSQKHARDADLAICLGTSLQITPACNIPLKTIRTYKNKEQAGKLVIINLQRTQHDKKAENSGGLVIRAKADDVMRLLMTKLAYPVAPYVRQDAVIVKHQIRTQRDDEKALEIAIHSRHGPKAPIPIVTSAAFTFKHSDELVVLEQQPFEVERPLHGEDTYAVHIKLHVEGSHETVEMVYEVEGGSGGGRGERQWSFVSTTMDYDEDTSEEDERSGKKPKFN